MIRPGGPINRPRRRYKCDERRYDQDTRRPGPQPQERRRGDSPPQAGGHHRPFGVGQVVAGLRHDLCRGAAPLHGDPLDLRPPVRGGDGASRRGQDHGPEPRGGHRAEDHQQEPPLDGGHRDRDQRLPASALRSRVARLFARHGRGDGALHRRAHRLADRRGVRRAAHRAHGPRGEGAQGPLPRAVRVAGPEGLPLRPHRRRDPRDLVGHAPRPLQGAHDRPGGRPPAGGAGGLGPHHDLAARGDAPGQGHDGCLRLRHRPAALLLAPPDVPLDRGGLRGSGAPHLLVQLAQGGLSPLQRLGRGGGLRPCEDHPRPLALAAPGGRGAPGQVPQQPALRHARDAGPAPRLHTRRSAGELLGGGAQRPALRRYGAAGRRPLAVRHLGRQPVRAVGGGGRVDRPRRRGRRLGQGAQVARAVPAPPHLLGLRRHAS